jgi:hypothetical protein
MKTLGAYIFLIVIYAPSFYVAIDMVREQICVLKHKIYRFCDDD